jgi:NADH-quinone oxidoreductase subunit F
VKPPYPVERGLFGSPTIVNNVETLAALPFIMREGPERFKRFGTEASRGTKLVSVSGAVVRPGVYEVEMGTPVSEFLKGEAQGVLEGKRLKAIMPGGISTAVLNASEALSCTIDYESFAEAGSSLGSGGMIVMDESTSMVGALADIARFFADESCGKCTPCREGTGWIRRILARMASGEGRPSDVELLCDLAHGIRDTSLCPLAESLAVPVLSFTAKFRSEFEGAIG